MDLSFSVGPSYKEIDQVDIVVNIVGGRFGSGSSEEAYSISQMELKPALRPNKQSYIFVEGAVMSEYKPYLQTRKSRELHTSQSMTCESLTLLKKCRLCRETIKLLSFAKRRR